MAVVCSKVIMSVEELEAMLSVKTEFDIDDTTMNNTRHRNIGVMASKQFHCPVTGCIYEADRQRYFTNVRYLKQHYLKVHARKSFACDKCNRGFAKMSLLTKHTATCGLIYRCFCGADYTSREALLTHAKRKAHELPDGQKVELKRRRTEDKSVKSSACARPSTIIVYVNNCQSDSVDERSETAARDPIQCVKRPCLILPKPAPLHDVPLQTVAAMALSELGQSEFFKQKATVGIQTDDHGRAAKEKRTFCSCRQSGEPRKDTGHHHHHPPSKSVRRVNKRSAETQTLRSTVNRKRAKWMSKDQCSQTDSVAYRSQTFGSVSVSTQTVSQPANTADQSLDSADLPQLYDGAGRQYLLDGARDWYLGGGAMPRLSFSVDHATTSNSKLCQTIGELDVDVGYQLSSLVSSATQTSPTFLQSSAAVHHLLEGPLHGYLDMDTLPILPDYSMLPCSSQQYLQQDSENGVVRNSSETQTDRSLQSLLLGADDNGRGDSAEEEDDDGILSSSNIQTQTSEDLESIPYDQLLSHMETQTSSPFLFGDLGGLCDIQTQTGYEMCNPSVADMHTQTSLQRMGGGGMTAQQINMETQTLLSLLEANALPFTDSHTQTCRSLMGILEYCCSNPDLDNL